MEYRELTHRAEPTVWWPTSCPGILGRRCFPQRPSQQRTHRTSSAPAESITHTLEFCSDFKILSLQSLCFFFWDTGIMSGFLFSTTAPASLFYDMCHFHLCIILLFVLGDDAELNSSQLLFTFNITNINGLFISSYISMYPQYKVLRYDTEGTRWRFTTIKK